MVSVETLEISRDLNGQDVAGQATLPPMRGPGRPPNPIPHPPNRLREARGELSLAALEKMTGFSRKDISKWETGVTHPPCWKLERIAKALGVRAYTLIKDYDGPADKEECALLKAFRQLAPSDRDRAIRLIIALLPAASDRRSAS